MIATQERPVARPKKPTPSIRFDIRAEPEWLARVNRQAERLGLSAAAYVRQAVAERLMRDEATDTAPAKPAR
jgi:predicted HicB family RNase H-like nuclease